MSLASRCTAVAAAAAACLGAPAAAAVLTTTDASWSVTNAAPGVGWNSAAGFDVSSWSPATVLFNVAPLLPGTGYVADSIWSAGGQFSTTEVQLWGRKVLNLAAAPSSATIIGGIDDDGEFYVNGTLVASSYDGMAGWVGPADVASLLKAGDNVIAFFASDNWPVWGHNHQAWLQVDGRFAATNGGTVPEPASAALLLLGLGALGARGARATAWPRRRLPGPKRR